MNTEPTAARPCEPTAVRRRRAAALAGDHGHVVSRAMLRGVGVDRRMVGREVSAGRWMAHGTQTVATRTGDLSAQAARWRAVWEVGHLVAAVDGVSALLHAGMTGFDDDTVHVSVRHTVEVAPVDGVRVHKIIRRLPDELLTAGVPRTRPAVAAVRAARGRTRRQFIRTVAADVADGAHSLGELDVVEVLRRRGLPEPRRQVLRRSPGGRCHLDLGWPEARLAVEVDGAGHVAGLQMVDDALRQNEVQLGEQLVLRVQLLGWRLTPAAYADQICSAYWRRARRAA